MSTYIHVRSMYKSTYSIQIYVIHSLVPIVSNNNSVPAAGNHKIAKI